MPQSPLVPLSPLPDPRFSRLPSASPATPANAAQLLMNSRQGGHCTYREQRAPGVQTALNWDGRVGA